MFVHYSRRAIFNHIFHTNDDDVPGDRLSVPIWEEEQNTNRSTIKNPNLSPVWFNFAFGTLSYPFFATFHAGSRFSTFLQTPTLHTKIRKCGKIDIVSFQKHRPPATQNSSSPSSSKHFSWKMVPTHPHRVQQRIFSPSTPRLLVLHTFGGKFRTNGGGERTIANLPPASRGNAFLFHLEKLCLERFSSIFMAHRLGIAVVVVVVIASEGR